MIWRILLLRFVVKYILDIFGTCKTIIVEDGERKTLGIMLTDDYEFGI